MVSASLHGAELFRRWICSRMVHMCNLYPIDLETGLAMRPGMKVVIEEIMVCFSFTMDTRI